MCFDVGARGGGLPRKAAVVDSPSSRVDAESCVNLAAGREMACGGCLGGRELSGPKERRLASGVFIVDSCRSSFVLDSGGELVIAQDVGEISLCRCRGRVGREVQEEHAISLHVLNCCQAVDDLVEQGGGAPGISREVCGKGIFCGHVSGRSEKDVGHRCGVLRELARVLRELRRRWGSRSAWRGPASVGGVSFLNRPRCDGGGSRGARSSRCPIASVFFRSSLPLRY